MESRDQQSLAKIVLLSSLISTLLILGLLYSARDYIVSQILSESVVLNPEASDATTEIEKEPIVAAVAKVNPAVVSVVITKDVPVYEQYYETFNPWGLFGGFSIPRVRETGTEEKEVGGGSGFIVGQDGMVVTNHHVVADDAARYSIVLNDGTVYQVDVLARDPELDIAILKINEPLKEPLTVATFGDSDTLELGQTVITIGNALAEFQNSVSVGVVSGLARSIIASDALGRSEYLDQLIQTDAAVNLGNSGGPLLNLEGEVVGVNAATSRGAENIGFAIPSLVVKQAVDSVREYGEIVRPYIGVRYTNITPRIAAANSLSVDYGALVVRGGSEGEVAVMPDSPAAKAGLVESDIILSIDGEELRTIDLASVLRRKSVGQTVTLEVLHEGEKKTVSVTLEKAL